MGAEITDRKMNGEKRYYRLSYFVKNGGVPLMRTVDYSSLRAVKNACWIKRHSPFIRQDMEYCPVYYEVSNLYELCQRE